jgi:hypothetical protein
VQDTSDQVAAKHVRAKEIRAERRLKRRANHRKRITRIKNASQSGRNHHQQKHNQADNGWSVA